MFFFEKTFHHLFTSFACFTFSSLLIKGITFVFINYSRARGDENVPTVGIPQRADRNRDEDKSKRQRCQISILMISVSMSN